MSSQGDKNSGAPEFIGAIIAMTGLFVFTTFSIGFLGYAAWWLIRVGWGVWE